MFPRQEPRRNAILRSCNPVRKTLRVARKCFSGMGKFHSKDEWTYKHKVPFRSDVSELVLYDESYILTEYFTGMFFFNYLFCWSVLSVVYYMM